MKIISKKNLVILFLIVLIHIASIVFLYEILFPIHLPYQNFLFFDLIGKNIILNYNLLFILSVGNLVLLYLIGRRTLEETSSLIPALIYALSPWTAYLVAAESFNIYLLFLVLLGTYGIVLLIFNFRFLGSILLGFAILLLIYSSLYMLFVIPFIFILGYVLNIQPFRKLNKLYLITLILFIPLIFTIAKNYGSFLNIVKRDVKIFSDPGLINNVNKYQGSAREVGLGTLARISENKYIFFSQFALIKVFKQFVPTTYFTFNEKLLNFSFTPPIYLGFLVPFTYGLYKLLQNSNARKMLVVSSFLVIPSVLAKSPVDLNKLVLFSPLIFFIISYGLSLLLKSNKQKTAKAFLFVTVFSVIFQMLITFDDITRRERIRYLKYFGSNPVVQEK